ncbi:hypothetical protein C8R46DRAFT_1177911 [Mycena filopes]|nr:hypothetical protein C8R46DRAFT_1177911 [Mycena filopes]
MHIKSSFPPLTPLPEVNVHHIMFSRPDQDYVDILLSLPRITTPFALISTYSTRFEFIHALKLTNATTLFNVLVAIEDPDVHLTADKIYVLTGRGPKGRKSFIPLEPIRPASKDTLAYLVMSSGTSGLPKAVMISHGNIICSIMQAIMVAQASEPFSSIKASLNGKIPVTVGVLPMFHSYGLHVYILRITLSPATYVIQERWNTASYLKAVSKRVLCHPNLHKRLTGSRYHATHLTLIPSAVHQLVNHPDTKKSDLTSVLLLNSGAAYLPPELAKQMSTHLETAAQISQGYGLSECTIAALTRPMEGMLGMGKPPPYTTGILLPGLDARIMRDDGTAVAPGEVGELWLHGGNVTLGYWTNSAHGRPDTLKVSGVQVSPKEIEDVLFAHPEKLISDASVAGVSGGRTTDEKRGAPAVIAALEQSLSKYKWFRGGIEVVKEIPKTPTGKSMRRVLQEQYEQRAKRTKTRAKL